MADTEISADTDTEISAETDTETDNFRSLVKIIGCKVCLTKKIFFYNRHLYSFMEA